MRLSVTRLYGSTTIGATGCIPEPAEYVIKQMAFDIIADGVTEVKEVDEVIRQLQQLRCEIAGGCTKAVIQPVAFSDQTEEGNHTLGK